MKRILSILLTVFVGAGFCMAQNVAKCQKQETLVPTKAKLAKTYGAEFVNKAIEGEIVEGMPEALLLKAFNTESVKYDAENCKAFNVYDDAILKRRRPNQPKPNALYFVIVSENKVVKIKPAEKNGRYKVKDGMVIY